MTNYLSEFENLPAYNAAKASQETPFALPHVSLITADGSIMYDRAASSNAQNQEPEEPEEPEAQG